MKKSTVRILSIIIFILALAILSAIVVPLVVNYKDPEAFAEHIRFFGKWGVVVMFFVQVAQILVALIPGELIEFVAGTLYGWFGGLVFCLLGIWAGQFIIFKCVRTLGKNFVEKFADGKLVNRFRFLQDEKKLKTVIFWLFFIPGTPKDLITYAVPFTKVSMKDFLVLSLLARIPSVVSSTFAGSAFANRDFLTLAISYAVIGTISIVGAWLYGRHEKKKQEKTNKM